MGWFFEDIYSALERQFSNDKFRKQKELAKASADPVVVERISAYRRRHPHLTPGVVLSAAKAGLPPDDPAIDRLAQAEAKRKIKKNKGWLSIGDKPYVADPLQLIARNWDEVESAAKTAVRVPFTLFQTGAEALQAESRGVAKDIREDGPLAPFLRPLKGETFGKQTISETVGGVAIDRIRGNVEGGAGIGDGYLPRGPAVQEQQRRARETYFLEYADHPVWHQPGDKREVEQHAGTTGRIIAKDIVQPGSRPFWLLSGIIDAGFTLALDPFAVIGKGTTAFRQGRRVFTAEEAGRAATGMIEGVRPAIHPPTTQNWLTLSAPGRKLTDWAAATNDPYEVYKKLGGHKGNITPDLAVRIADARSTDDVLDVLGAELGTGLRTKPITSRAQPVGGYLGEVKSSIYENRLFNQMPHNAVRVDDPEEVITQLIRLSRAGELPEDQIGQLFNDAARATSPTERVNVLREAEVRIAKNISTKLHGPISGDNKNFDRLRDVFKSNEAAMTQVVRSQIANKTGVKSTRMNGIDVPLSSVHLEAEYLDEVYQLPDPRQMRRMLTQYGRLLNNPVLDVPISALDHIQNVWRGASIIRLALTLRTIGEEQAWMAGAGYDSIFRHPFSAIAWAMGRKGTPTGLQPPKKGFVRLWRVSPKEGSMPGGPGLPEWVKSQPETQAALASRGRWFGESREEVEEFYSRQVKGDGGIPELRYVDVPVEVAESSRALNQPDIVKAMSKRPEREFVLPAEWATRASKFSEAEVIFDPMDELSSFSKALSKSRDWQNRIIGSQKKVVPFTDPDFTKAWSNDIWRLREDEVARRLAGRETIDDVRNWLRSDEGAAYRQLNDISDDTINGYTEMMVNRLKGTTYADPSLLDAIATGQYNGRSIFAPDPQGKISLDQGFAQHLKKLIDSDISPDHTIGDLPKARLHPKEYYGKFMDAAFDLLLTKPSNYLSRSVVFKQDYWKKTEEAIYHASPETQAKMIAQAESANMGKKYIKSLRERAKSGSGDLTFEEFDLWAKAQALQTTKKLLTDLSDKNQLLDAMRLTIVFGEAWKQSLTTWAKVMYENPAVLPRATAIVRGGFGSGFFYTDEQTGEEKMAYPGAGFLTGKLTEAFGGENIPFPMQANIESLTMFGANPLIPSFGPVSQVAVGKLLPDTPDNEALRKTVIPYDSDPVRLPGWLDKVWTAAFTDPQKNIMYGNLVWDVARYLHSTGEYDINSYAGQQALEDKARKTARLMLVFRGLAQSSLPAAPSYQDLAMDPDGHTTLAFTLTKRYQELLEDDRSKRTQEATSRFITEFGMDNLLYMQSASKGGDVFTKAGLDWVKRNGDIVDRYPEIYSLLAPSEGGLDMKAYMALFENGQRRPIPPKEAMALANHRAAKMVQRSAEAKLPLPNKRTDKQRIWLDDLKERLKDHYPGFDPEFKGNDRQAKIEQLSQAINDPMLQRLPQTKAISAYLGAREQVRLLAQKKGIVGWETAKSMRTQRKWLRDVAGRLIEQTPQFSSIYSDLFDGELAKDTP